MRAAVPMPMSSAIFADRFILGCASFGREIVFQVIVEFDALEAGVFGKLQAFAQRHPVRVRKRPEINRLLHLVALRRFTTAIGRCPLGSRD